MASVRVGVFGGTFDPVHWGHLILAEQCREQMSLDRVLFIPAARPPHKSDRQLTPFAHRVEMLALAIAGHLAFSVDELEKDRAGPSYTIDTLEELGRRQPDARFFLLVGSDCLAELGSWRDPERIIELAELVVAPRAGWATEESPGHGLLPSIIRQGASRVHVIQSPQVDISSHDLRERAAAGRSLRYLLPRSVECYIQTHRLYETKQAGP